MHRTNAVFVYLSAAFAIVVAVIVVAFPYDTSWIMVAILPLVFLAIMSACVLVPNNNRHATDNSCRGVVGAFRSDEFESSCHHLTQSPSRSPPEAQRKGGLWIGTLRMGTTQWRGPTIVVPVRFALSSPPVRATIIDGESLRVDDRVLDINVVECDCGTGMLHVRLTVMRQGHIKPIVYEATSVIVGDLIVPDDDTSAVVFEARKHRVSHIRANLGGYCNDNGIRDDESAAAALATMPYAL